MSTESPHPGPHDAIARSREQRAASAAAAGDAAELRALLLRLAPKLRRAAWNLAGGMNDAADLVQEALLRISSPAVLRGYRGDGPLDAYLLAVGVRQMISVARRGRAERERTFSTGEPEQHAGGREDVAAGGLSPAVREALEALPERARTIVLLVVVGDLTYAEVAVTLGMEVGTVKSAYSRARATLRGRLVTP